MSLATLPALAEALAVWFPELEGRAVAVADSTVTKDNVPAMPYCQLALIREEGKHAFGGAAPVPIETFVVEFWFKPRKYPDRQGKDTPFWVFYDYDALRDELLTRLLAWDSPRGGRFRYDGVEVDAMTFATVVSFRISHEFRWCKPQSEEDEGVPVQLDYSLKAQPPLYWTDECITPEPVEAPTCPP